MDFVTEEEIAILKARLEHLEKTTKKASKDDIAKVISIGDIDYCFEVSPDHYDVESRSDFLKEIYLCFINDKDLPENAPH